MAFDSSNEVKEVFFWENNYGETYWDRYHWIISPFPRCSSSFCTYIWCFNGKAYGLEVTWRLLLCTSQSVLYSLRHLSLITEYLHIFSRSWLRAFWVYLLMSVSCNINCLTAEWTPWKGILLSEWLAGRILRLLSSAGDENDLDISSLLWLTFISRTFLLCYFLRSKSCCFYNCSYFHNLCW